MTTETHETWQLPSRDDQMKLLDIVRGLTEGMEVANAGLIEKVPTMARPALSLAHMLCAAGLVSHIANPMTMQGVVDSLLTSFGERLSTDNGTEGYFARWAQQIASISADGGVAEAEAAEASRLATELENIGRAHKVAGYFSTDGGVQLVDQADPETKAVIDWTLEAATELHDHAGTLAESAPVMSPEAAAVAALINATCQHVTHCVATEDQQPLLARAIEVLQTHALHLNGARTKDTVLN